ncbi:MAG TPA: DUF4397 domain-containing protein [Xanthomonadales bacterium]|nr:DUF4397 domain-containing protein [Xanthomonadales bacterium]
MKKLASILALTVASVTAQPLFAQANVAVLHLAPFAPDIEDTAVDIYINDALTFPGVLYKDFVDYTELPAGEYDIDIAPAGTTDFVISGTFPLEDGIFYSVAAVGNGAEQPLELLALVDNDGQNPPAGSSNVRIAHTAPFADTAAGTEVSIRTDGGDVVAGLVGVPYKADSGFLALPEAEYDLKVANNEGTVNYIDPLPVAVPDGATLTLFAIGDGRNQPLGILAFPLGELPTQQPVDNSANGWWNIQEGEGRGIILQPIPAQNRLVGTWYDYDADGNPVFFTFDSCQEDRADDGSFECSTPGAFDGTTAETALFQTTGGGADSTEATTTRVGTVTVEVLGCNDLMAVADIDGAPAPEMVTAKRLTQPIPCTIED